VEILRLDLVLFDLQFDSSQVNLRWINNYTDVLNIVYDGTSRGPRAE